VPLRRRLRTTANARFGRRFGDGPGLKKRGFKEEDFAKSASPVGSWASVWARVESLMHTGRSSSTSHANDQNAGCDLRNVPQEIGHNCLVEGEETRRS